MNAIRYTKYSFNDTETEAHFSVDFSQSLDVKERHLALVVNDLSSFNVSRDLIGKPFNSVLELDIDGSKLSVGRNYVSDSVTFDPSGVESVGEWLQSKLGKQVPENYFSSFVISYTEDKETLTQRLIKLLTTSKGIKKVDHSPEKLMEELDQIAPEKGMQMLKLVQELAKVGAQLDAQDKADDLQGDIDSKSKELESVAEKLASVNGLLARQQEITAELQKYGQLAEQVTGQQAQGLEQEIQRLRDQQMQSLVDSQTKSKNSLPAQVKVKRGIFGLAGNKVEVAAEAAPQPPESSNLQAEPERLAALEKFFVDKALITAQRSELDSIQKLIKEKLGGADYKDLEQKKAALDKEILQTKAQIAKLQAKQLSPTEFLQLRRNRDMLKVEKARLQADLKKTGSYDRMLEIVEILGNPKVDDVKDGIEIDILQEFDMIRIDGQKILFRTKDLQQWQERDMSLGELFGLVLYVKFNEWESDPVVPMVLVNIQHHLEGSIKDFVNAKINQLSNIGQLVLINLAL